MEFLATAMVGFTLFFALLLVYILNREKAIRYSLEVFLGLVLAYLIYLVGYSTVMAYLALGVTLSLSFYMK